MNTVYAEANILDRIMHLLEEGSVVHLMEQDDHFAEFIGDLYITVNNKSEALRLQEAVRI